MNAGSKEDIATIWTRLYLGITDVRNQWTKDLSMGSAVISQIKDFPELITDAELMVESLTVSLSGFDHGQNQAMEYFLHNDISKDLVRFAEDNIPENLRDLIMDMFTDLLISLPPVDFLLEKLSKPITALLLLIARECSPSLQLAKKSQRLLVALNGQIKRCPPLRSVFLCNDTTIKSLSTSICRFCQIETLSTSNTFKEQLLDFFENELLGADSILYKDLIISIVSSLIKAISMQDFEEAKGIVILLHNIALNEDNDSDISTRVVSIYRELFVEKVFPSYLLGCCTIQGWAPDFLAFMENLAYTLENSVIFIPLFSKAVRVFDSLDLTHSHQLMRLYCYALRSDSLRFCFPLKQSSKWTDALANHRNRIDGILKLLPLLHNFKCFREGPLLSEMYQTHLMWAEACFAFADPTLFGGDQSPSIFKKRIPRNNVLKSENNKILLSLYTNSKAELSLFWEKEFRENFNNMRFIILILRLFDSFELYSECFDSKNGLIEIIAGILCQYRKKGDTKDHSLKLLTLTHSQEDIFSDLVSRNVKAFGKNTLPYILGHFLLRLAALMHVNAMKDNVTLIS